MRIDFRVSHDDFDNYIDFTESQVFFSAPIEQMTGFQAWGIAVLSQSFLHAELKKYMNIEGDIYVSGMVSIVFPSIEAGSIEVALYTDDGIGFMEGPNGIARVTRSWGKVSSDDVKQYSTDFISDWPYGSGSIHVYSKQEIMFSIDVQDCIPIEKYIHEPKKYSYRKVH